MGMAASQARLLLLTARKSDIESQLMFYANEKLDLTRQSSKIAQDYSEALDKQKIVWKNDSGDEVNLSYNLLMRANSQNEDSQYILTNTSNGKVMLDSTYLKTLGLDDAGSEGTLAARMNEATFLSKVMGISTATASAYLQSSSTATTVSTSDANGNNISDAKEANYYLNLYDAINQYGWESNDNLNSTAYIQNQVINGNITIKKQNDDSTSNNYGDWESVTDSSTDSPYSTETDDSADAEAEAIYNSKKNQIDYKEQGINLKVTNLDTERSAVDTEIDSVKKIIEKNIERSFKLFQNA